MLTMTDGFCGAGGSSLGAQAAGVKIVLAMNHNEEAMATHELNFPDAEHASVNIDQEDPRAYPSTDLLWMSPECTNHSPGKGIKLKQNPYQTPFPGWTDRESDPFVERSRATMNEVYRWTKVHRYKIVFVENVPEVTLWGKYEAWLKEMDDLGYEHQVLCFNSMFARPFPAPVPQSRDRWYCVFWKRELPTPDLDIRPAATCLTCGEIEARQVFFRPKTGPCEYRRQYIYACPECRKEVVPHYTPASYCIDWSLPILRIGERKRLLVPNTLKKIATGIKRFPSQRVFLMSYYGNAGYRSIHEPIGTCTKKDRHAIIQLPESGNLAVEDCGLRMLTPDEIRAAMGFPIDYLIASTAKYQQIQQYGLAVTPAAAYELVSRAKEK